MLVITHLPLPLSLLAAIMDVLPKVYCCHGKCIMASCTKKLGILLIIRRYCSLSNTIYGPRRLPFVCSTVQNRNTDFMNQLRLMYTWMYDDDTATATITICSLNRRKGHTASYQLKNTYNHIHFNQPASQPAEAQHWANNKNRVKKKPNERGSEREGIKSCAAVMRRINERKYPHYTFGARFMDELYIQHKLSTRIADIKWQACYVFILCMCARL